MDLSALESAVRALEGSLDSVEWWLASATFLVVVGLILEYWHAVRELVENIKARPPFPWKKLQEIIGGILVTVGVAGELALQFHASTIETDIRSKTHQIEGLLNKKAGDAELSAAEANKAAKGFESQIAESNARVKVAEARIAAAELQTKQEERQRVALQKQVGWRNLTAAQRSALANSVSRFSGYEVNCNVSGLSDGEQLSLCIDIMQTLRNAGWKIAVVSNNVEVGHFQFGVVISSTTAAREGAVALVNALRVAGLDPFLSEHLIAEPATHVTVQIGNRMLPPDIAKLLGISR
jgi:hypothetical protein